MLAYLSPLVLAEVVTGLVVGGMLFFGGVVAPLVFSRLPGEVSGGFIRQMFPIYYLVMGAGIGIAALLLAFGRPLDALLLLLVSLGFLYARQIMMPKINHLRDAELAGDAGAGVRFARWHRYSVWLNGAQLVVLVVVLFRLAAA